MGEGRARAVECVGTLRSWGMDAYYEHMVGGKSVWLRCGGKQYASLRAVRHCEPTGGEVL